MQNSFEKEKDVSPVKLAFGREWQSKQSESLSDGPNSPNESGDDDLWRALNDSGSTAAAANDRDETARRPSYREEEAARLQHADISTTAAELLELPPSSCREAGLFPVLYMSATCMFPSERNYTWRVRESCFSFLFLSYVSLSLSCCFIRHLRPTGRL